MGDVLDVVYPVFDAPVALDPAGEQSGVGLAVVQRGDRVDGLGGGLAGALLAAASDDLDRAGGVGEQRGGGVAVEVDDLDGAGFGAAVGGLPAPRSGRLRPRQRGQRPAQDGLVGLDGEQVVAAAGVQLVRVLALAVQRVRGEHDAVQVAQRGQGGGERGDLVAIDHRGLVSTSWQAWS